MESDWKQGFLLPGLYLNPVVATVTSKALGKGGVWGVGNKQTNKPKQQLKWKMKGVCRSCREYLKNGKLLSNCIKSCARSAYAMQQKALQLDRMRAQCKSRWWRDAFQDFPEWISHSCGNKVKISQKAMEVPDQLLNFPDKNQSQGQTIQRLL